MAEYKVKQNKKIDTKDHDGQSNGFVVPIINELDNFVQPEQWPRQVYMTAVAPGTVKGPHLHKIRWGLFTCVKGNIKIVIRDDHGYHEYFTGEDYEYATIQVPAGVPSALVNMGSEEALVLNMPAPSWNPDVPDDWDVSFEDYDFSN